MSGHRPYKDIDYRFGQLAVKLRDQTSLTQMEVANSLHVSQRTIQHWEGGTAFPDITHLKNLIALYFPYGVFTNGKEEQEVRHFWEQADESSGRRPTAFDSAWFEDLLHHPLKDNHEKRKRIRSVPAQSEQVAPTRVDWGEAPELKSVYGRESELADLSHWILNEHAHVVAILGMGGIGKTTLAVKLTQEVASQFDFVIWRSLRNAPPLHDLLVECMQTLSPSTNPKPSISALLENFQKHRVLLILDNVETLHQAGKFSGNYREGYQEYQSLFQLLALARHQSCLLLTGREMPNELEPLEGAREGVRAVKLGGLSREASQSLLGEKELFGTTEDWDAFVHYYSGNPLALKISAAIVRDLFGGDLAAFLREAPVTLHTLHHLLDKQFEQLTALENNVLFWLAIEREGVSIDTLRSNLLGASSKAELLPALMSLRRRSLIERDEHASVFHLQPVLLEFITARIVQLVCNEITRSQFEAITHYALMKSKAKDYIRESQIRLLISPILTNLVEKMGNKERLAEKLRSFIPLFQKLSPESQGYASGNLLNLIACLQGNLNGEDFSHLVLRQAHLQGVEAQDSNFAECEFVDSSFTEPLEMISTMILSPSGRYLAAATYNGQLRLWDNVLGKPLWTITGARRQWSLVFNQDESLLSSGGYQGEVCIYEARSGHLLKKLEGHHATWVHSVYFHPNGRLLASGGDDNSIRLWNLDTYTCQTTLVGHEGRIFSIEFSKDGKYLISSANDGKVHLWDYESGQCIRTIRHTDQVATVRSTIHPNSKMLATCCDEDTQIKFWDISSGECLSSIEGHAPWSGSIAFNPEGTFFASSCINGTVEVWEIKENLPPQRYRLLIGHKHPVNLLSFGAHGLLASLPNGENIKLWDVFSGKLLHTIQGYSRLIGVNAFSPDGKLLAQGDANGMVRVYNLSENTHVATFKGHAGPIWCMEFSPDGRTFASGADDRFIKIWDANTFQCIKTLTGNTGFSWALAYSPDGRFITATSIVRALRIWLTDVDGICTPYKELECPDTECWSVAYDPGGKMIATGHENGKINLINVETGQAVAAFRQKGHFVGAVRFTPDGKYLMSSTNQELFAKWELASGKCIQSMAIEVPGNRNRGVAISRNGEVVVTGSGEAVVLLWRTDQAEANAPHTRFEGHSNRVWSVTLSPDDQLIASGDEEGTTLLSDVESGKVLRRLSLDRPYERMNIAGVSGLNSAEVLALSALGGLKKN